MSGAAPHLAPQRAPGALTKGRSPIAQLLHALNQPLTGLQCSLELAAAGPRRPEEYARTLREGLELTLRMRILVEALRELTDTQPDAEAVETFQFDGLMRDTVDELFPVAETLGVRLLLASSSPISLTADRRCLATLIFRLLESALSLSQKGSDLQIVITSDSDPEQMCLAVSWHQGPELEHSPFSRQELGLLIAQAGLERAGAEWTCTREKSLQSCTVRLPLRFPAAAPQPCQSGVQSAGVLR